MKSYMLFTIAALVLLEKVNAQIPASTPVNFPEIEPSELRGTPGADLTFTCTFGKSDGYVLKWFRGDDKDTELVTNNDYEVEVNNDAGTIESSLTIKNANIEDNGVYSCHNFKKTGGSEGRSTAELIVRQEPMLEIIGNEPIDEESSIELACHVNGATNTSVTWKYTDQDDKVTEIDGDEDINGHVILDPTSKNLTITGIAAIGKYTCSFLYSYGTGSETFTEDAIVGEQLSIKAENSVKFTEGERGYIDCLVRGRPTGKLVWTFSNRSKITPNEKFSFQNESKVEGEHKYQLFINDIQMEDRMEFICLADNGASTSNSTVLLRVRDSLAALWPFLGICAEVVILILIILIHEKCSKGEDYGEDDEEEDEAMLVNKNDNTTNRGNKDKRKRGSNN